ncbi:hypothetical protein DENSPDRAFT_754241, partial [Dentipellis sp. KUC8613]
PFDAPDADLILRSAQSVDFRTHKVILSLASPVFRDMFSVPQPTLDDNGSCFLNGNGYVDGLPMVQMSETTTTLHYLLTAIYPFPPALPASLEEMLLVLAAATKFEMSGALSTICATMHMSGLYNAPLSRQALRIHGIACRHDLEDKA